AEPDRKFPVTTKLKSRIRHLVRIERISADEKPVSRVLLSWKQHHFRFDFVIATRCCGRFISNQGRSRRYVPTRRHRDEHRLAGKESRTIEANLPSVGTLRFHAGLYECRG